MVRREVLQHHAKSTINGLLRVLGLRLERHDWGPRGWSNTLGRMRAAGFDPELVLDVGAAQGTWTEDCLQILPAAQYHLFEPVQHASVHLKRLCAAHDNVHLHAAAVGSSDGTIKINANGDQSSIYSSHEHRGEAIDVPLRRLETALAEVSPKSRIFLKADVQGYEIEVVRGAGKLLPAIEAILLEVSIRKIYDNIPLAHDIIAVMGSLDYRIFDICNYSQRPLDRELAQADIMFVRSNSGLFAKEAWGS